MSGKPRTAKQLFAFLAVVAYGAEATKLAVQTTELQTACKLAGELKKAGADLAIKVSTKAAQAQQLTDLAADILAIAFTQDGVASSKLKLAAELARQQSSKAQKALATNAKNAVLAAARAGTAAGRIDDIAAAMLKAATGGNSQCVASSTSALQGTINQVKLDGCTSGSNNQLTLPGDDSVTTPVDIAGAFKGISDTESTTNSGATTYNLLHKGTNGGFGQPTAAVKLLGGLLEQSTVAGTAPTWKGGATNYAASGEPYKTIHNDYTALEIELGTTSSTTIALLAINDATINKAPELTIPKGSINADYPAEEIKLDTTDTANIKAMLKQYRDALAGPKLDKERDTFFRKLLDLNSTACELGTQLTAHQDCDVTKTQNPKCDGKKQGDCEKATGCEWNKTERKCKLTENIEQDAQKENQ
uniref:Variant surface glycoprotein 1392 n=1 Tax=Trypanosoma brucei TaxID=5691 RepID=M4SWB1_9TRYP|nr:variant surface glycoprotein 1392 [Trypanosoma brucei]